MWNGQDTIYGLEWIEENQSYFKVEVDEDAIYRVSKETLEDAGFPINQIQVSQIQLFRLGKEVPLHTTTNGLMADSDFIYFYGEKNRNELDTFLFRDWKAELINEGYSLITDTVAYFFTWNENQSGLRYKELPNDISTPPSKEDFFWEKETVRYNQDLIKETFGLDIYSDFGKEGFGTRLANSHSLQIDPLAQVYENGPAAKLSIELSVRQGTGYQIISLNNQAVWSDSLKKGTFDFFDVNFEIPVPELKNDFEISVGGEISGGAQRAVSKIEISYPRNFSFTNEAYYPINIESGQKKYVEIEGFDLSSNNLIFFNFSNNSFQRGIIEGGVLKVAIPESASPRNFGLCNLNSGIKDISNLKSVDFDFEIPDETELVFLTSEKLRIDPNNVVEDYANYRKSIEGGGYSTQVLNIEDIYNLFSFGIRNHPMAIRNLIFYLKDEKPEFEYLFLIGKGIEYDQMRTVDQFERAVTEGSFLIPTYGVPGADNKFSCLTGSDSMEVSIGRLAARDAQQVAIYFEKIKSFEGAQNLPQTVKDRLWMKRIAHLGGGRAAEQSSIQFYLSGMEEIIENNRFGAMTDSYFKTSNEPIQSSISDRLINLINNGVSIITYMGHSYSGGFEFSLDNPDAFENFGKYPLMLSYGCFSGQIHQIPKSIGEEFVLIKDKGAIGFVASTGTGSTGLLSIFGNSFYEHLGDKSYGTEVGYILKNVVNEHQNFGTPLFYQSSLLGDPTLKINPQKGIDLVIDPSSVQFTPEAINTNQDSFKLSLSVVNLGQNISDSTSLSIEREIDNGQRIELINERIIVPEVSKKYEFTFPVLEAETQGLRKFYVSIDHLNFIEELPTPSAENNNDLRGTDGELGTSVLFYSNDVEPVYPAEFAIIGTEEKLTLIASGANTFSPRSKYLFEIDTTKNFNSPLLEKSEIEVSGAIVKWSPMQTLMDSTVYYWRTQSTLSGVNSFWQTSSFLVEGDNPQKGWNQSHFQQFEKNSFENTRIDSLKRKIEFVNDFKDILLSSRKSPDRSQIFVNTERRHSTTASRFIFVYLVDTIGNFVKNEPGDLLGSGANATTLSTIAFRYRADLEQDRLALINFLENVVPSRFLVCLITTQSDTRGYAPEMWAADSLIVGTNLFEVLEKQGATQIRKTATVGSLPYALIYKKGESIAAEKLAQSIDETAEVRYSFPGNWFAGNFETQWIGPSLNWERLEWNVGAQQSDKFSLDLIGQKIDMTEEILISNFTKFDTTLNWINAQEFPLLKLKISLFDSLLRTAPEIEKLRIIFDGLPDLALSPSSHFSFYRDSIFEGDSLKLSIDVENLSCWDADSLTIRYSIIDNANNRVDNIRKINPLLKRGKGRLEFAESTKGLSGKHKLEVEINPNKEHPERKYDNNFGSVDFLVVKDEVNPLLDVTFDGIHIMNGDLVSSKPFIQILLKDENQFFELNDSSNLELFLSFPNELIPKKILLTDPTVEVFQQNSTNEKNSLRINFAPNLELDGTYKLIIKAKDASGNRAGTNDFEIKFRVITKSTISNLVNYPNPFSTSTRFVYTLTGNVVPQKFKIQILTVAGKIVREISEDEIGTLKIGTHMTDFEWDGTDDFGNQLANGIYLYKLHLSKQDDMEFEKNTFELENYIKNGFGKLVILR